jgi:nucleoid-associated protein YgaU
MAIRSPGLTRGALAAALVAAIAGGLWYGSRGARTDIAQTPPAEITAADAPAETAATPAPDAPHDDAAAETAGNDTPSLDLLRVEPDGGTVLAGRAEPGATVTILAGETPVAEVEADASGDFVALFDAPPAAAPRPLSLEARGVDGAPRRSDAVAILLPAAPEAPPAPAVPPPPGAASDPPEDAAAVPTEPAATPDATEAAASSSDPAPAVAAAVVLTAEGAEVTPVAPAPGPGGPGPLALAAIDYAEAGAVRVSGVGPAGASLRAYVDDGFALGGTVDAAGRWSLDLAGLAAGVYRLRIDQIGADGRVARRIETPFQRDFPALAADRPGTITVQPGNNLWTLARVHYGSGVLYTQIYTANSELIRDPDLIYPGQILTLPDDGPAN